MTAPEGDSFTISPSFENIGCIGFLSLNLSHFYPLLCAAGFLLRLILDILIHPFNPLTNLSQIAHALCFCKVSVNINYSLHGFTTLAGLAHRFSVCGSSGGSESGVSTVE